MCVCVYIYIYTHTHICNKYKFIYTDTDIHTQIYEIYTLLFTGKPVQKNCILNAIFYPSIRRHCYLYLRESVIFYLLF